MNYGQGYFPPTYNPAYPNNANQNSAAAAAALKTTQMNMNASSFVPGSKTGGSTAAPSFTPT